MRLFTALFVLLCAASKLSAQQLPAPLVLDGHLQRQVISATAQEQQLIFEQLIPGERYLFTVPEDLSIAGCRPVLSVSDANVREAEYDAQAHTLLFTASKGAHQFTLTYPCLWSADNPPRHYVSLQCQTCKKTDLKEYLKALALLEAESGYSAEDLVKDVLIGGNCFDVTNVTFEGQASQIGKFMGGLTNIGYNTGLVMATGDVAVITGPNDQDNASAGFGAGTPDNDLTALSGSSALFDMANIEFDFTPTQSPLTFEFVFASEEYCEYVGSQFNDVFGFFVSGPGISGPFGGADNIAILPGGGGYVAINNVNHLSNTGFYVNNTGANGTLCGQNASFLPSVNEVQFDGFTRKMIAVANVIPCETYHIKLKIADVGDGAFDSAVFLRDGSFDGGGNASIDFIVDGDIDDDDVFESCGTVQLQVDRVGGNASLPLPVQFTISGTATAGTDYAPFPTTIIIPSGQDKVLIPINILSDAILEGEETLIVTLKNPCSCLNPEEVLFIYDLPILDVVPDTVTICGAGVGTVTATPVSGVDPYTYKWQNGVTDPTLSAFVSISTNFKVTVTDGCGKTVVETARINVTPPPTAQLLPPAPQLCPGQSASLVVNFNGNGPFSLTYTQNGDYFVIDDITDDPYTLIIDEPGLYTAYSVTDGNGCVGPGTGTQLVLGSALTLTGVVTPVLCAGQTNGSINTTVTGGQGPYNYNWDGPQPIANIPDPVGLQAGTYNVTVTDGFGCTNAQVYVVASPAVVQASVSAIQGANCANPAGGSITINVAGGTPNYTFNWSNSTSNQNPQNLIPGVYSVTVSDSKGCSSTTSATVPGDFSAPTVVTAPANPLTCTVNSIVLDGTGSSSGPGFTLQWAASPGNISSGGNTLNPTVNQAGNYILTIGNTNNGCNASDTVSVTANNTLPTANAGSDGQFTCTVNTVVLNGNNSSQGSNITYQWSASNGGVILNGVNTLSPQVGTAGQYTLLVTDSGNGCTQTDQAVVTVDTISPNAQIATPGILTCVNKTVTLNGSASTPTIGLSYQWSTTNGNIQSGQNAANAVIVEAGVYTLQVTNTNNGCTDLNNVAVTQSADVPVAAIAAPPVLTCSVQQLTLNGAGTTTGPSIVYNWTAGTGGNIVSGPNTLNPVVSAPATYTLNITNTANSCSATNTITVDQDIAPPVINAGLDQILSCTTPQSALNGSVSGAGTYTYAWAGPGILSGANTLTPVIDQIGTYTLTVTNTQNGCSSTDALNITADQNAPVAAIATAGPLTCAIPQLTINASASSTGSNFTYLWSGPTLVGGQGTLSPVINLPGTYTLFITNTNNGCTDTQTLTIGQDIAPPGADAGPNDVLNCFEPQLIIGGNGNPSGVQYAFQWNGPGIVSGGNTPAPTVNQGGTYNLTVTNTTNGCVSTDAVLLNTDFAVPQADAGAGFQLTCIIEEYILVATASQGSNFTYDWSTLNGNFVTPNDLLNPTVDGAGIYTLVVTNTTNGCTNTSSVTITQSSDVPVAIAGTAATLTCAVTNTQLNGAGSTGGPGIAYTWTTQDGNIVSGNTTLTPVVNAPGTYVLTVFNVASNCDAVSSVVVPEDVAQPIVDAGPAPTLTCAQPALSLAGNVAQPGTYVYQWQASAGGNILSGANTLTPFVDAAGNYSLTVTNQVNGCSNTASLTALVDQQDPVAVIQNPATLTCVVQEIVLDASASTTGNMTYDWATTGGNFTNLSNPLQPIVDQAGTYNLLVTNQDNGCTSTLSVAVPQNIQLPNAQASVNGVINCATPSVSLSGSGSSQGSSFAYNWSTQNGSIVSGPATLAPSVNGGGVYQLTVLNSQNGCSNTATVAVSVDTIHPVVAIAPPAVISCLQTQTSLIGSSSQTGSNISYAWSTTNGTYIGGQNSPNATAGSAGQYTLLVTNNSTGCSAVANTLVTNDIVLPLADAGDPQMLTCTMDEATLSGSGSTGSIYTYLWTTTNGQLLSGANTLSPTIGAPGTYTLLVTNTQTGCKQTDQVNVTTETNLPTDFDYVMERPSCKDNDGVVTFGEVSGGFGPYLYSIDGGASFTPSIEFSSLTPGTYQLAIQDANGCEFKQALQIPKAPDPAVDIIPEVSIDLGESIELKAILPPGYPTALIDTVIWDPLEGLTFKSSSITDLLRPTASPTKLTEYTVTVISGDDCEATDRVLIRVDNEPKIYIPNVFTPSKEDGANDKVLIFAKLEQVKQINAFQIYDRWGARVYEAYNFQPNDPDYGWDGRLAGKLQNPAIFVYYAEIELIDGRVLLYKGDVTLAQ